MRTLYFIILIIWCNSLSAQTYRSDWSSLDQRPVPQWWADAKFGIFIHWGVYSVPAYAPVDEVEGVYMKYAEHYENRLLTNNKLFVQHHKQFFGEKFTYQDFAPLFTARYFNPGKWADLFVRSGAKYVVLTSKHHDGFCLWPSKYSPKWNSLEIGPHRDLAGDLAKAVRSKNLHMGFYYSLLEWNHPLYRQATIKSWVDNHMIPQMKELVNTYKPDIIFSDGEWDYHSDTLKSTQFLSWLYNESPVKERVVVNDRWGKETRSKHGGYYTTEYDLVHKQKGIGEAASHPWEESRGIGTSYGYNRFETNAHYFTSKQLIDLLIDKVSNGGNLLLNIGPDADGLIPVVMQERLLDIGKWLEINGEAIYGSSAIDRNLYKANQEVFYTTKGNDLYIICKKWPKKPLKIKNVNRVSAVSMLGLSQNFQYKIANNTLLITPPMSLPGKLPCNYAWVFKISNVVSTGN